MEQITHIHLYAEFGNSLTSILGDRSDQETTSKLHRLEDRLGDRNQDPIVRKGSIMSGVPYRHRMDL